MTQGSRIDRRRMMTGITGLAGLTALEGMSMAAAAADNR